MRPQKIKMKKFYLLLSIITVASFSKVNAQVFTQGDVTVMALPQGNHDSTQCASMFQMMYNITVQNSFVGDEITIKDQTGGFVVYNIINSSGQNPWTVMVPVPNAFGIVTDDMVSGGVATFFGPPNKVISGPDTVYNIYNFNQVPVPNPCLYSTVTGQVYVDYNSDCTYNTGDVALSSVGVAIGENLNSTSMTSVGYGTSTDFSGVYSTSVLQTWMTSYNVSIGNNYQFIFPYTTCSPTSYTSSALPGTGLDFSLQCTSLMDVQCWAGSAGVVRPNIPFYLFPYVSNIGCNAASGTLKLVLDANVTYNAGLSTNLPNYINGDTLIWNYTNLSNLSNGAYWNSFFSSIYLTPNGNVVIGDTLCFRVFTNVPVGDVDAGNNDYTICLPVVNSYDPNLKEVTPKGVSAAGYIPVATSELTYTIHFQNTGTAVAYNISVIDTLDANITPVSLTILGSSNTASPKWIAPGVVQFDFNNIYLADYISNEPASHGYIRFKVALQSALPSGTVIQNRASIYFDSNPAVLTNRVTNTLSSTVGVNQLAITNDAVEIYPNPSSGIFHISDSKNQVNTVKVFNLMGELVYSISSPSGKSGEVSIDLSKVAKGIYFVQISTDLGVVNKKVTKE